METKQRVFGSDQPFNNWIRSNKNISATKGFGMQDVDSLLNVWHKHSENGNRDRQHLMMIETKVYHHQWGEATYQERNVSQLDTLSKMHLCLKGDYQFADERGEKFMRNHGVSFLVMNAPTPPESTAMWWGRFKWTSHIQIFDQLTWLRLEGVEQLESLLRFEIDPDFGLGETDE
jgi:hypothetical protein